MLPLKFRELIPLLVVLSVFIPLNPAQAEGIRFPFHFGIGLEKKCVDTPCKEEFHVELWQFYCRSLKDCSLERNSLSCFNGVLYPYGYSNSSEEKTLIIEKYDPVANILSFRFPEKPLSDEWISAIVTLTSDSRLIKAIDAQVKNYESSPLWEEKVRKGEKIDPTIKKAGIYTYKFVPGVDGPLQKDIPCNIWWPGLSAE